MDLNTWLTIVTIFIAIFTVLAKEERQLLLLKLHKAEYYLFFILLGIVIPFLILFPQLAQRWPVFSKITIRDGFLPENLAFATFYILFLWLTIRFLVIRPVGRINQKIVGYLNNLLVESSFPQFFSLFSKYSSQKLHARDWFFYKQIILHPAFLKGIILYRPSYLNVSWKLLQDEIEFKAVFRPFLTTTDSVYFEEIKANNEIDTVLSDSPFLNSVIVENLAINMENGLQKVLSDFSKQHIRNEDKDHSIYLRSHTYYHTEGEEGYDLPLYYHIRFIGLLYSTAISNKVEVKNSMYTLYAGMIQEVVKKMRKEDKNKGGEYPTNYHWIISTIFSSVNRWLEYFNDEHIILEKGQYAEKSIEYFDSKSMYVDFIPSTFNFCVQELFKGVEAEKLSEQFVAHIIHYNIFTEYFRHNLRNELREKIEENVIRNIPVNYLPVILSKTLDEEFASNFELFVERNFRGHGNEPVLQERLWSYLAKNNQL